MSCAKQGLGAGVNAMGNLAMRVREASESGRAFLQEHGLRLDNGVNIGNYFASLKSTRRENLVGETNLTLICRIGLRGPDRLADIIELARYECFAAAAGHEDAKMAVGTFTASTCASTPWLRSRVTSWSV